MGHCVELAQATQKPHRDTRIPVVLHLLLDCVLIDATVAERGGHEGDQFDRIERWRCHASTPCPIAWVATL